MVTPLLAARARAGGFDFIARCTFFAMFSFASGFSFTKPAPAAPTADQLKEQVQKWRSDIRHEKHGIERQIRGEEGDDDGTVFVLRAPNERLVDSPSPCQPPPPRRARP